MTGSVSNTSYALLMNSVRARLPGALDEMIEQELGVLLSEFFDKTNAWYEAIPFDTVLDQKNYYIYSSEAEIHRLMRVLDTNSLPVEARFSMPDQLELALPPSGGHTWTAYVALRPVPEAPLYVPDWIWSRYRGALEHGICWRMMSQPAKTYSNVTLATYHAREWRAATAEAVADVFRSFTYRGQSWAFPQTFRASRRR